MSILKLMSLSSFYILKKKQGVHNGIWKLIAEEKEISEISNNIKTFHKILFKRTLSKNNIKKQQFFNYLSTKTFSNEQYDLCQIKYVKLIYSIL